MKTSIALVGFMGTGKTAVGQVLAARLKKRFIELDASIVERAGKPISDIFRQDGEIAFRELEIEAVRSVAGQSNSVIACGGGVVLNRINIDRLKQGAVIVLLTAAPSVILKRTAGDTGRPLLDVADRAARMKELLRFRRPFYERAADMTVNTSRLSVYRVADEIISRLRTDASLHFQK